MTRPASASTPHAVLPRTSAAIEDGIAQQRHLGAQLQVILRGETIASFAYGSRSDGDPMTPDTLLLWRSAGKPLTAIAIAQQWERGRLDLHEPVARHLPEFGTAGKARITPHHLLTHTAGFLAADSLPDSLPWSDTLHAICQTPLEPGWIPGTTAAYQTNASWFVLAEIIQRLDGRAFSHYLRDEVLVPLGLVDSWIGLPPAVHRQYGPRIGTTFTTFHSPPTPHPSWDSAPACALCRPGSNARGPAADLAGFYLALHRGGSPVLRPSTLREFTRRHRSGLFDRTLRHVVDFGLGFLLNSNHHGRDTVPYGYGAHASPETFGHSGAQSSCAFLDPDHGLIVAWICNGLPGEPRHQQRQRAINSAIYEDLSLA